MAKTKDQTSKKSGGAIPIIYRRRYIPSEKTPLLNDVVVSWKEDAIVTRWKTLRPRNDFDNGVSCYLLNQGIKINRFLKGAELIYHYIDIVELEVEPGGEHIFNDLLIDVIIENDGSIKVLDLDQLAIAIEQGLVSQEQANTALRTCAWLLEKLYSRDFDEIFSHFPED